MGFLSRLFGRGGATAESGPILWVYVRCNRCGEPIRIRVNLQTDAQREYDDSGRETHSFLRKEILGNRCPALMSVELQLDNGGRVRDQQGEGCTIITREVYEEARAAITPPDGSSPGSTAGQP